jgi:outer membrane protein, heavy metal efflux system
MRTRLARPFVAVLALACVSGCGAVTPGGSREAVAGIVAERSGTTELVSTEAHLSERTRAIFAVGVTADDAVELTLLRNHELRALYTDLDLAEADLVQARLLHNPVVDAAAGLPIAGGTVDLSFGVAMDFIDLLYVPLRERVASALLEEAQLRIAAEVLELAWRARMAATRHQADEQMLELRRQIAEATGASAELAQRMRSAGNVTELELASETALADEAKLELRLAEVAARESREELNALMGLWGTDAGDWALASSRLPDPPDEELDLARLETRAIERSLDLAAAERLVVAAGETVGLDRASALFPEVVIGGSAGRDDGQWDSGPTLSLPIPLFDWGQARNARARAELRRARHLHHALAVRIRAETRSARDRLLGHRDRALHYRTVQLPLRDRVVAETQRHYNAMQISPLELFRAKEQQIDVGVRYVDALRDYWTSRADLGLILAGRIPPREFPITPPELEQLPRFPFPTL